MILASMGPERKAPENQTVGGGLRHGETLLQWGRSGKLRKTCGQRTGPLKVDRASMGPERKAPENGMDLLQAIESHWLQWGRSGKLRKTPVFHPSFVERSEASMGPERKAPENRLLQEADEQGLWTLFCERPSFWSPKRQFLYHKVAWVVKQYFQYFKELTRMRASPGKNEITFTLEKDRRKKKRMGTFSK